MAGQDKPARGRAGQAALLPAARAGGCTPGKPPSCVPQGREVEYFRLAEIRGHEGKAHMSTRLAAGRSCPFLRLVTGEASPAPPGRGLCPLPSPLRGALPPRPPNGGKFPPYPPLKGRVRDRTGQAGPWPGRTSRPLACGKGRGGEYFRSAETRERASMTHTARASASGPKRESKFFAKLSFKKAGGAWPYEERQRRPPLRAAFCFFLFSFISGAAPDGRPQSGRE